MNVWLLHYLIVQACSNCRENLQNAARDITLVVETAADMAGSLVDKRFISFDKINIKNKLTIATKPEDIMDNHNLLMTDEEYGKAILNFSTETSPMLLEEVTSFPAAASVISSVTNGSGSGISSLVTRMAGNSLAERTATVVGFLMKTKPPERIKSFIEILFKNILNQQQNSNDLDGYLNFIKDVDRWLTAENQPISEWRDKFGMTLLMNMVIFDGDKKTPQSIMIRNLAELLIREKYFDDAFINVKADYDLAVQFQLQHYQDVHKMSKQKCTVIAAGQTISLKKVKKKVTEGEQVDKWGDMKDDQVKMISKDPVKLVQANGKEIEKRIMITCRLPDQSNQEEEMDVDVHLDNFYRKGMGALTTEYFSMDELSDDEEDYKSAKSRCSEYLSTGTKSTDYFSVVKEVREEVIPEHFDSQSVVTKQSSEDAYVVKKSKEQKLVVKLSKSVSTKVIHTPKTDSFLEVNKYFSKNTTLLLLSCKTGNWNIVRAILEQYPSLFCKEGDVIQQKHPLYFQDDFKAHCLHLAIKDGQFDICKTIIDKVDVYNLKTNPIEGNKTALKFVEFQISQFQDECVKLMELKEIIEKKIGKKQMKRKGKKTDEEKPQKVHKLEI